MHIYIPCSFQQFVFFVLSCEINRKQICGPCNAYDQFFIWKFWDKSLTFSCTVPCLWVQKIKCGSIFGSDFHQLLMTVLFSSSQGYSYTLYSVRYYSWTRKMRTQLHQNDSFEDVIQILYDLMQTKHGKKKNRIYGTSPVKTNLAEGSATSSAVLPSVFRIFGSAPCCRRTGKGMLLQRWKLHYPQLLHYHLKMHEVAHPHCLLFYVIIRLTFYVSYMCFCAPNGAQWVSVLIPWGWYIYCSC